MNCNSNEFVSRLSATMFLKPSKKGCQHDCTLHCNLVVCTAVKGRAEKIAKTLFRFYRISGLISNKWNTSVCFDYLMPIACSVSCRWHHAKVCRLRAHMWSYICLSISTSQRV